MTGAGGPASTDAGMDSRVLRRAEEDADADCTGAAAAAFELEG